MFEQNKSLMTVSEAAEALRVSKKTVYRMVEAGQLRAARIRNTIRISPEELDRVAAYEE